MSATLIRRILCELEEVAEWQWREVNDCRELGLKEDGLQTLKHLRDLKSVIRATRKELFKSVEWKEV